MKADERFWSKTTRRRGKGCWLWTGALDSKGYGSFYYQRGWVRAHRWAYENMVGPVPEGLHVLHKCDVRHCVKPSHLFLGNSSDNHKDKIAKGRGHRPGKKCCVAKLTEEQVVYIMARLLAGESQSAIARDFGVHPGTVHSIWSGRTWKHLFE